jgi:hypothetical protein
MRGVFVQPPLIVLLLAILASPAVSVAQESPPATPEPGFFSLFDGSEASFADWQPTGTGTFDLVDGAIVTGSDTFELGDLSLLYYAPRTFDNFVLRLQFRVSDPADNSGILLRFRDPTQPIPQADLAAADADERYPYRNLYTEDLFWIANDTGFEVQINDAAVGNPFDDTDDGQDQHRTGAIYDMPIGTDMGEQAYQRGQDLRPGEWNDLEIEVLGETYTVWLNGQQVTNFTNPDPHRGRSPSEDPLFGYIGVETNPFNPGHVDFRAIRIRELPAASSASSTPTEGVS